MKPYRVRIEVDIKATDREHAERRMNLLCGDIERRPWVAAGSAGRCGGTDTDPNAKEDDMTERAEDDILDDLPAVGIMELMPTSA